MKTDVGTLYRTDGKVETVRPHDGKKFSLQELQGFVGGLIQIVPLRPGNGHATLYVNEEGKIHGLPSNLKATKLTDLWSWGDYIVGDAIVVRKEDRKC